jgi:prolyl-tRNA editing enzyme YbaK/EbsC (Cys-tRNA(Pro) deacylase)
MGLGRAPARGAEDPISPPPAGRASNRRWAPATAHANQERDDHLHEEHQETPLSAVARVAAALRRQGLEPAIVEFADSTRTAEEAARAVGTSVEQIVKSLVFLAGGEPILVLASGGNRVDTTALGAALGRPVKRADAARVRQATGFAIGGVPPVGHATTLPVLIDRDLCRFAVVYAAAGTPHAVFPITPGDLCRATGGRVMDVKETATPTGEDSALRA